MFENFSAAVAGWASAIPFDCIVWLIWGTFAGVYVLTFVLACALPRFRSATKRPLLCLIYAYTALTFAAFLLVNDLQSAAFVAAVFWIAAYAAYGLLCAVSSRRPERRAAAVASPPVKIITSAAPPARPAERPVERPARTGGVAGVVANNNVRLEHAIAVTDRLLEKNLGKTDRQELEKLKNTLEVMKIKGNLSPAEGEILNENFNTLLKLMAKYNI